MDPIPEDEIFRRNSMLRAFGEDIGESLDQLQFEFEELENEKEIIQNDSKQEEKAASNVEKQPQNVNEKINVVEISEKKHTYSHSIRTHMFDSLKNVRKRLHIKKGKGKEYKLKKDQSATSSENSGSEDSSLPNSRLNSVSSSENNSPKSEPNNNASLHAHVENSYSTVPRNPKKTKKIERSHTLSPQKQSSDKPVLLEVPRDEGAIKTTPPVVIEGNLVYDFQYKRPISPKSPTSGDEKGTKTRSKVGRNQSMSRLLRLVTSPQKSPTNKASDTPLRELYKKTVMSHSVPYNMDTVGKQNSPKHSPTATDKRHNSLESEEIPKSFSNNMKYYSTLPLPRKNKR